MSASITEPCRHSSTNAASAGLSRAARAAEKKDEPPYAGPYYVVFNASGGWDTTYLMDPKGTGGINRLYQEGDILTQGRHKYAPNAKHTKYTRDTRRVHAPHA